MGVTVEQIRALIQESNKPLLDRLAVFEEKAKHPADDWRARFMADPEGGEGGPRPTRAQRAIKDGNHIGAVVLALAHNDHDVERSAAWAEERYGGENLVSRALAAGDAAGGGFLLGAPTTDDVIELLGARAVVRLLNPIMLPMENGIAEIPKLAGGAQASYTGENQNATSSEPSFAQLRLVQKKLITLVPLSNDIVRFARPGSEQIITDDIVNAMARREDLAFIRDDGLQDTPKGLLNWALAANRFNANGTVNLANVTDDMRDMVDALEGADVRMIRPGWLMAPRSKNYLMTVRDGNGNYAFRDELLAGTLWGWPFQVTTQIPTDLGGGSNESEIYLVDFADAVIGEATEMIIDSSSEAAYWDTSQGAVQAAFSRDQSVIRAIAQHDFGMRHDASVVVLEAVLWGT